MHQAQGCASSTTTKRRRSSISCRQSKTKSTSLIHTSGPGQGQKRHGDGNWLSVRAVITVQFLNCFREWHPKLMSPRKAWALPLVPAYFDVLKYYQYITKTRIVETSLDNYYLGLVPPTASYEVTLSFFFMLIVLMQRRTINFLRFICSQVHNHEQQQI